MQQQITVVMLRHQSKPHPMQKDKMRQCSIERYVYLFFMEYNLSHFSSHAKIIQRCFLVIWACR